MQYDPSTPIAVFLGPSLARHKAEQVLSANYYPPVRMGDVYRLMATGVRAIVVIDGVFHATTPVWPRELVTALDNGIAVFGAASMGALRAAELDQLGMIGCGQIYEWYRDGLIAGDDEVALLHTEEALGYQAMSEPLVNMRHVLTQALGRGLLTPSQADTLLELVKNRYFGDRSYHVWLQSALVKGLPPAQRGALTDFLTENPPNLKQEDAKGVLRRCANWWLTQQSSAAHANTGPALRPAFVRPVVDTVYPAFETVKRAVFSDDHTLIEMQSLVDRFRQKTDPHLIQVEQEQCASRFFLSEAAASWDVVPPPTFEASFRETWIAQHMPSDHTLSTWLRQIGLPVHRFEQLICMRATQAHLLAHGAVVLGIDMADHVIVVAALARRYGASAHPTLHQRAVTGCVLAHWAVQRGIHTPPAVLAQFTTDWLQREGFASQAQAVQDMGLTNAQFERVWSEQAMYQWLLNKGPVYFGYDTYAWPAALVESLQLTGQIHTVATQDPSIARSPATEDTL